MPMGPLEITALHRKLGWHYHDFCLFHQAIYAQIRERESTLKSLIAENKTFLSASLNDEWEAVQQARLRDTVYIYNQENKSMALFADQLAIIGLWTMVEQYCGRTLIEAENQTSKRRRTRVAPYKWSELCNRFIVIGLKLPDCKSYNVVNECRVLNNKIKHVGAVDAELAKFSRYTRFAGCSIDEVEIDTQLYANSTFEFVTCVMEATGDALRAALAPGTKLFF